MNIDVLDKNEVAALLKISPRIVLILARKGVVPSFKVGKSVRFLRNDILKFIRKSVKKEVVSPEGNDDNSRV